MGWCLVDAGIVDHTVVVEAPVDLLGDAIEEKTDRPCLHGTDAFVDKMLLSVTAWDLTQLDLHLANALAVQVEIEHHVLKIVGESWLQAHDLVSISTWDQLLCDNVLNFLR